MIALIFTLTQNRVMLPRLEGLRAGERRALARAISIVDNNEDGSHQLIKEIFPHTGNAHTVGFTGAGGAGKSTLIGKLIPECRALGWKVAILAVDPTSPITGGAILGDRVRMMENLDNGVFMRSLASRGAVGGVSRSLRNVIRVLDYAGYNLILVESVGAGQLEIEISKVVDTTVVVFTPQTGDNVQAIKAGLTEIGDVYVINKADLDGSGALYTMILDLIGNTSRKPLVLKVSSKTGKGVREVAEALDKILKEKGVNYKERQQKMLQDEIREMVFDIVDQTVSKAFLSHKKKYGAILDRLAKREIDPFSAASQIAKDILR